MICPIFNLKASPLTWGVIINFDIYLTYMGYEHLQRSIHILIEYCMSEQEIESIWTITYAITFTNVYSLDLIMDNLLHLSGEGCRNHSCWLMQGLVI